MTDYIKREDAIKALEEDIPITDNPVEVIASAIAALEEQPSADVVEVVRCKDCKKYNTDDCMMIHGKKMNRNIFANDFCSYGERTDA